MRFPGKRALSRKNYQAIRFCAIFSLSVLVLFSISFNHRWVKEDGDAFTPFTREIALASGYILNATGIKNHVYGTTIINGRFRVQIKNGCNGVFVSMILISAFLAYPFRLFPKILGIFAGLVFIQFINFIRIVTLFFIGIYFPEFFDDSHIFFAQALVISSSLAFWLFWINKYTLVSKFQG